MVCRRVIYILKPENSHKISFQIRNCLNHNIPAEAFAGFENIDHFRFEGGSIDSIDINAWSGLNVEKLMNDAHSIPRNLGFFEVLYTKFPSTTVPPGLLYNMKNLTAATLRVMLFYYFFSYVIIKIYYHNKR